jgi:hypothetical protein
MKSEHNAARKVSSNHLCRAGLERSAKLHRETMTVSSRRLPEGGQNSEVGAEENTQVLLRLEYTPKQGSKSIPVLFMRWMKHGSYPKSDTQAT